MRDGEILSLQSRAEWRAWLDRNHDRGDGVWLVVWGAISYEDAVLEALAHGWIDGGSRTVDETHSALWLTVRKPRSGWSSLNRERVARLEREGLMTEAGRRAVDHAKASGTWSVFEDAERMLVPDDLAAALDAVPGARAHWESFPPSAKKNLLGWISLAKRPGTRERRVRETAESAGVGERAYPPAR